MAGTSIGGKKAAQKNKANHGEDFYVKIGSVGGKNGHTGGFHYMKYVQGNFDKISESGRKGGTISRRSK